jgi:phage FluMu gp28-like protein
MLEDDIDPKRLVNEPSYFVEKIIGVEPFDYQKDFMDEDSRKKLFVAGRQVGKSRTCAWLALHKAITTSNSMVLLTAKSQRQASELFNQVKKELGNAEENNQITEDEFGVSRDTRTEINFDNRSRIKVVPIGRDGENVRTYTADMIIVDEAAFINEEIFQQVLSPMLAVTDGDFIIISTPYGKQGFFWNKWSKENNWFTKQVPSWENPKIGANYIEEQREQLTSIQFKQEVRGEFDSNENSFLDESLLVSATRNNIDCETEEKFLGADVARYGNDLSAYVMMDANGNVFSLEHTDNLPLTDAMGRVKHYDNIHDFKEIVVDATGLGGGVVDTLKQDIGNKVTEFQFNSVKKKQDVYNPLMASFENNQIKIPNKDYSEASRKMYKQLDSLKREYTNNGYMRVKHEKDSGRDDYADALALANWIRKGSGSTYRKPSEDNAKPFNMGSLR